MSDSAILRFTPETLSVELKLGSLSDVRKKNRTELMIRDTAILYELKLSVLPTRTKEGGRTKSMGKHGCHLRANLRIYFTVAQCRSVS